MTEQIILVDAEDNEIGTGEKMAVHQTGQLHRAFSILVFNKNGELLLQQRAKDKYHCPGLWANTCCSHPRPSEDILVAAQRRLQEEMGFDCPLEEKYSFIYKAEFTNGLTEHEFDHVLIGDYNGQINFNSTEVQAIRWLDIETIKQEIKNQPAKYTDWFKLIIAKFF